MNYYYGLIDHENNGWGFVTEDDPRADKNTMILLSEEEHDALLEGQSQGKEIVFYDGQVFNAEYNKYYIDDNGIWQKRSDEEVKRLNRIAQIDTELTKADMEYQTLLDTPVEYTNGHLYKPKWAEETYINLLSAGALMPSLFPQVIWDSTELEENAVEMTLDDLKALTAFLANIQQGYFNTRKAKKSALVAEKEELEKNL